MTRENLLKTLKEKYPETEYKLLSIENNFPKKSRIKILCPIHGIKNPVIDDCIYGKKRSICNECGYERIKEKLKTKEEDFEILLKEKHGDKFKILEYINMSKKVKVLDLKENKIFFVNPRDLITWNYGNEIILNKKLEIIKKNFIEKYKKSNLEYKILDINQYKNCFSKIDFICEKHGVFNKRASSIFDGGCPECSYDNLRNTTENFIKKSEEIHINKYNYSKTVYKNNRIKVIIVCPIHGEFLQSPKRHLSGDGCPSCNESKGERKIVKFLQKNKIKYSRQKTFDLCINEETRKNLFFDFYIQDKNLLIEYDGEYHFLENFNKFRFSTNEKIKDKIEKTIYRDTIKNNFCKENNIKLLRISYKEFLDIEKILSEKILSPMGNK
jgi:hypothetical protein